MDAYIAGDTINNIRNILDHVLGFGIFFIVLGVFHLLIREYKTLWRVFDWLVRKWGKMGEQFGSWVQKKSKRSIFAKKLTMVKVKWEEVEFPDVTSLLSGAFYIIGGIFVVLLSFVIVNTIIQVLSPESFPIYPPPEGLQIPDEITNFKTFIQYHGQYAGLYASVGVIAAGISLTLSAGGRWLVNIAKFLFLAVVVYLVMTVFVVYS